MRATGALGAVACRCLRSALETNAKFCLEKTSRSALRSARPEPLRLVLRRLGRRVSLEVSPERARMQAKMANGKLIDADREFVVSLRLFDLRLKINELKNKSPGHVRKAYRQARPPCPARRPWTGCV